MVCGFHEHKEAEKQDVKYSAYLRDPFYYPAMPGMPPRATYSSDGSARPVYSSFVTREPLFLSEFPFHSFSNDFSDMGIVEYAQDREAQVCVWIDLHKYKYSICTHG